MGAGFDYFDFVHYIHALSYLTKYAVAPALAGFGGVVEEVVVFYVDKELGGGAVGVGGAGHGDGAGVVGQAIVGLIVDGRAGRFLLHIGG